MIKLKKTKKQKYLVKGQVLTELELGVLAENEEAAKKQWAVGVKLLYDEEDINITIKGVFVKKVKEIKV